MSKSALSLYVFGIYLVVLGIVVVTIPNVLLGIFGMPQTNEVWIRIVGVLVLVLAFYYTQAARKELTGFIILTVYTRATFILFLTAFVLLGFSSPVLILFGVADLLGALWTGTALRSDRKKSQ